MNLVLGLVFRGTDGTLVEERWQYLGCSSVDDAVAGAHADGVAGEFGRAYVGVGSVVELDEHDGVNSRPFTASDTLRARPAKVDVDEPWVRLNEIESAPWFQHDCAFGTGTLVGVQLRRCLSPDVDVAVGAADLVGEAVAHQMTLVDVTPLATTAMGALLPHAAPAVREALVGWLDVIAGAAGNDDDEGDLRAQLVAEGVPEWLADDLVVRAAASRESAKGCRAAFMTPLFDTLEAGRLVGDAVVALRRSLR